MTPGLSGQCASLGFDQCGGVWKPKGGVGGLKYLKGEPFWGGKKTQDNTFKQRCVMIKLIEVGDL